MSCSSINNVTRFPVFDCDAVVPKVLHETPEEKEKIISDLQQVIVGKDEDCIDRSIDNLLSSAYDITEIWQQVISRFVSNSPEQGDAKTYYKVSAILKELENQNIAYFNNTALYNACATAEAWLERHPDKQDTRFIRKKPATDHMHSLLVDYQKKTFTILGIGPIKAEGGRGKVRSAIEVALQQETIEGSERVRTKYVARKTNFPDVKISKREIDNECRFGGLRTVVAYRGKAGSIKVTFTMEAYQLDLFYLLDAIYNKTRPNLTFPEKLQILDCVATQLEFMHEKHNTIHHDLKPENVMLRRNKDGGIDAKIIDFGYSYSPLQGEQPPKLSSYGTYCYTAPELVENPQKKCSLPESKAQDIYALGCIVYMLKYQGSPIWLTDVEKAVKTKDEEARQRALRDQKQMADNADFTPMTGEDYYDLLMYRMLHPDPSKRIAIQEIRTRIVECAVRHDIDSQDRFL